MIYRINWDNFLIHMIDWFDFKELIEMYWVIISAEVANTGIDVKVTKNSHLFPNNEIVDFYTSTNDYESAKKMYFNQLSESDDDGLKFSLNELDIANLLISPMLNYRNVCIMCGSTEDWIIDMLGEFVKKKFDIEFIDLNQLFKKGHIHGFYLDRKGLHDKMVPLNREIIRLDIASKEKSAEGRAKLLETMTKKQKQQKLKELGIKVKKKDKNLDRLLRDAWE